MSILSSSSFVGPLLRSLVVSKVRTKLARAEAKVVAGMRSKGMEPPAKTAAECSRDAIFRFWRIIFPGDISDAIRDATAPRVVPLVLVVLGNREVTLEEIVTTTREVITESIR